MLNVEGVTGLGWTAQSINIQTNGTNGLFLTISLPRMMNVHVLLVVQEYGMEGIARLYFATSAKKVY